MKLETLKTSKRKYFWCALGVGVVLLITIVLTTSMAKYQTTESIKIAEGTINYSLGDINVMAIYLNSDNGYEQVNSIPESGYVLNSTESYCNIGDMKQDVTISYDFDTKTFTVSPYTQGKMKCYLYFDVKPITIQDILASKTVSTRGDFSVTMTADTTGTVYSAEDDDGTSYYFAGAPTDNYVYFAGFYWRIIRINGDGTLRLIYDGTSAIANGIISSATQIGESAFNSSIDDNMYVGYMYTSGSIHGLGNSSTIKGVLDSWYDSNLASYGEFIDTNAGFCGDRGSNTSTTAAPNGTGGTGTTTTSYAAYYRLYYQIFRQKVAGASPTFKCADSSDLYTVSSSSKGNKALTNPIGLITADEVAYAGGVYNTNNTSFYLYTGQCYWTLSPSDFSYGYARVFYLFPDGRIYSNTTVDGSNGVRPVINLRTGTLFTGSGTSSNPYVVLTS